MKQMYITFFQLSIAALLLTIILTYIYRFIANKKGILASITNRSLHKNPTPRGGGIVFSWIFMFSIIFLIFLNYLNDDFFLLMCVGGGIACLFGFIDDIYDIRAIVKLFIQIFLSVWIIFIVPFDPLFQFSWLPKEFINFVWPVCIFIITWILNVFNFIDGIDGLAASGTLFICWTFSGLIYFTGGSYENIIILFLLGTVCLGFLFFNFAPASIFMGDSGSLFLGYMISVIAFKTIIDGDISFWTWCIIMGYFITDTTLTTLYRLKTFKTWYRAHRSHAYQNLANLWGSHLKVNVSIIIFHFSWLLPLCILSVVKPEISPILLLIGIIPVIIFFIFLGPKYSDR